jgi:hypothetical protein
MSKQLLHPRTAILLLIMAAVAAWRLLSHYEDHLMALTNFTPIGAMALFGGSYFKGKARPFVFPLLTLFLSDLLLSFTIYAPYRSGLLYNGWFWTYIAFALMVLAGKLILKEISAKRLVLSVVAATVIHWLVSDIGGCLQQDAGVPFLSLYGQRLLTAIPYEMSFLAATIVFSGLMFGSFELLQRKAKWGLIQKAA